MNPHFLITDIWNPPPNSKPCAYCLTYIVLDEQGNIPPHTAFQRSDTNGVEPGAKTIQCPQRPWKEGQQ